MWCSLNSATGDHCRADVGPDANITGRRPSPSIRCADTTLFVIGCGLSTSKKTMMLLMMMMMVPPTQRVTFGDRAFPVAAVRAWNSQPPQIIAVVYSAADKGSSVSAVVQLTES